MSKKRLTKKEIYAKYGITYDSKADKILYGNNWIKPLLKEGNSKTGKKVLTFSLPAGTSGSCVCDCVGCYAKTGFYTTSSVCDSLALNLSIVNENIDFFIRSVNAQLQTMGKTEIRIHAAGDFNTANPTEYTSAWKKIIRNNPECLFWTYTKVKQYETLFDGLNNANIVKSVINDIGFNFGHCDYIIDTYKKLKAMGASVYICRCGIDKNQHCQNCKHCIRSEFVLFIEHSTEYKAEDDSRFDELKALIEAQE